MAKTGSSRVLLIVGVLALTLFGIQQLPKLLPTQFEFDDIPSVPDYRMLVSGEISRSVDPFVGLDSDKSPVPEPVKSWVSENICSALFGATIDNAPHNTVPVAYFTDYQCPYCRILSGALSRIVHSPDPPIHLTLREFPVFGDLSRAVASASLAAGMQGAHLQFHEALMSVPFRPSNSAVDAVASDLGLDLDRFRQDIGSLEIQREMLRHRAVGELFGIYGTPALVVGRTLVIGKIAPKDLGRLIEIERNEVAKNPCRVQKN